MPNYFEITAHSYPVISTTPSMSCRKVLHSWKEISNYTGCGIRTVQRYEQHCGLPVRRASGNPPSAVLAFSDELDAWFQSAPKRGGLDPAHPTASGRSALNVEHLKKLLENRNELRRESKLLADRLREIRKQTDTPG
jgi:hypothetical protein